MKEEPKEAILAISAHNDDHLIGAGGALAKYAEEGKEVTVYVFSYGEGSHPHFQRKHIVKTRVRESKRADKILGCKELYFFGLDEGKFTEQSKDKGIRKRLKKIIRELKPVKIFTHSFDDPHPDHRAVYSILKEILNEMNYKGELYTFGVWNPFHIRKRDSPKLVVDITKTFNKKVEAFKKHESQLMARLLLLWSIYFKALTAGLKHGCKYAEVFFKVK